MTKQLIRASQRPAAHRALLPISLRTIQPMRLLSVPPPVLREMPRRREKNSSIRLTKSTKQPAVSCRPPVELSASPLPFSSLNDLKEPVPPERPFLGPPKNWSVFDSLCKTRWAFRKIATEKPSEKMKSLSKKSRSTTRRELN